MFLSDCHTHTHLSPDSEAAAIDMARAAQAAGLSELCFTDHVDFLDFDGKRQGFGGWEPYLEQFRPLSLPGVALRLGVELGEAWEDPALAREIVSHPAVDLVIGSVHNLSSADGGVDFYFIQYTSEAECHRVLDAYFDCMEALVELDCFDVLGHIIYPLRYMNRRDGNHVTLERYLPQLRRIFTAVAQRNKGIEVNTCRGETVEDWREVLTLYKDCGGRIVTLGSDAHAPQDVGKGIPQAAALLKELGFDLAVYEKRKAKLISL